MRRIHRLQVTSLPTGSCKNTLQTGACKRDLVFAVSRRPAAFDCVSPARQLHNKCRHQCVVLPALVAKAQGSSAESLKSHANDRGDVSSSTATLSTLSVNAAGADVCVIDSADGTEAVEPSHTAPHLLVPHATAARPLCEVVPVPPPHQLQFQDTPFKLRPYQQEAITEVISKWNQGQSAQMVMLPTGCGKTVVFAAVARYITQYFVPPVERHASVTVSQDADASQLEPQGDANHCADSADPATLVQDDSTTAADADGSCSFATARLQELLDALDDKSSCEASTDAGVAGSLVAGSLDGVAGSLDGVADGVAGSLDAGVAGSPQASTPASGNTISSACATCSTDSSLRSSADSSSDECSSGREDSRKRTGRGRNPGKQQQEPVGAAPAGAMRVLVLAHRHELLHQAEDRFRAMWGSQDITVSWVKGRRKEFDGQIVFASAATAVNCLPSLRECNFSLVVVDEAHHSVSPTYKAILEGLGFVREVLRSSEDGDDAKQHKQQQQDWDVGSGSSAAPASTKGSSVEASSMSEEDESFGALTSGDLSEDIDVSTSAVDSSEAGSTAASLPAKTMMQALPNPDRLLLGFSATPYRLKIEDSRTLYDMFHISYVRSIPEMIRAGYLSQVVSHRILTQTDLQGVAHGKSDFVTSQLSPLVNSRARNRLVLESYLESCTEPCDDCAAGEASCDDAELQQEHEEHARLRATVVQPALEASIRRRSKMLLQSSGSRDSTSDSQSSEDDDEGAAGLMYPLPGDIPPDRLAGGLSMSGRKAVRKAIGFAVDIQHAEAMNAAFNAAGVRASAVHSLMPHTMVKEELQRFKHGKLDVLFNVEVLTEGFDEPSINAVLMARPTQSKGLYTQMLGRGLRIFPNKKDCLVLDFTDKHNKAGNIVDVRVLFPEFDGKGGGEMPKKGPAKIQENSVGGQVDVLERAINAKDLAWQTFDPHCMTSIFTHGNVWLVHAADMGPRQRSLLGLNAQRQQHVPAERSRRGQNAPEGSSSEDEEGGAASDLQDRYVVLHQHETTDPDPCNWKVAYKPHGHTWRGLTLEDAYSAALDYIDLAVRQRQASQVQTEHLMRRLAKASNGPMVQHLTNFTQSARWRTAPASYKQLGLLKQYEVPFSEPLTRGQASDLISAYKSALASRDQLQQLQELLQPSQLDDLPVPLLRAHAAELVEMLRSKCHSHRDDDGVETPVLVSAPSNQLQS